MIPKPTTRPPYPLLVLFLVLATAIAGLAYRHHLAQREAIAHEVHTQLLAIADMKVKDILAWRDEKQGQARMILNSRLTLEGIHRVVMGGSAHEQESVGNWMESLCRELHFSGATLTNLRGDVVLARGRRFGGALHIRELALQVAGTSDVSLTDFHLDDEGAPPHLGLNVPLRLAPGAPVFGTLLIGLDPEEHLYPMLRSWPVPAGSGESLLVRRDGNDVRFISPLRSPSATRRIPLSRGDVAAVRAIVGEQGAMEAADYRGAQVFAAAESVPGTGWRLIAKIDAEEVLAPLRLRSGQMGGLAISLICAAGAGVFALWRRRELKAYRARYEGELERRQAAERYEAERTVMNQELRRTLDALQISESRFRAAFDQAAVGMTQVSLDRRFRRVNQRYCEITGYSREELLQMAYSDLTHPEDGAAGAEQLAAVIEGHSPTATWEKRYIRKDGSVIWVAVTTSLLRTSDGEPIKLLGVIEDITARKGAQEALRRSEERFRQVVEDAPEAIMVMADLRIRYVNPAAVRLFGAESAAELIGSPALDRIHPEEREDVRARALSVLAGHSAEPMERRYLRLDGETVPVEVSASPIDYDGERAALVFLHDRTERQRAEEEHAKLEQRLRQAQKMESVGRLAGGVAHDFNNHLTVINGYCDMLLDELASDDPLRDELGEIRAAGDRAAALTQQLLAFSRKQVVEPRAIVLNDVIEEFCRLVRRLIGDDIEVITDLDPKLGAVMADRGQMHQVLMNLAVNARDAMPKGGQLLVSTADVRIGAAGGADVEPGDYVLLTFSDTGVGMSPETLQKIFEPFFTTKPLGVGTGLGLATVYGIVEQSGGFIRVSSQPGYGTTFRIYLPRVDAAPPPSSGPEQPVSRVQGSGTILVVEDQPEVRKLAMGVLKKAGYKLLEAGSGPEALVVADAFAEPIDLVITDVVMPGMTGRELANRLQVARPAVKVLYTSGYTADVIGRAGVLDIGLSYLPKPFVPADLAAKVREVLCGTKTGNL